MNGRSVLIAAALLACAGAGIFEARVIVQQREALQAFQKRATETRHNAARLRGENDAVRRQLDAAEAQLAPATPATTAPDATTMASQRESNTWLVRVKQLKQLFAARPDQRIPEMQWLTDADWLRIAKHASLKDEHHTRKAMGEVRAQATANFGKLLNPAMREFALTASGEPPSSILALTPYFEITIDTAILERYEIVKGGMPGDIDPDVITVREKAPIDADYDSRRQMSTNGRNLNGIIAGPPGAWIPNFEERSMQAFEAYTKANQGVKPRGVGPTLPYFNPPLEPAKAALILRFEQEWGK